MLATADQRYNDAAIEPNNPGYVSNESPSHYIGNVPLGRCWWQLSDDVEILSYSNILGDVVLAIFRNYLFGANEAYLLAGDQVVVKLTSLGRIHLASTAAETS